MSEGAHPHLAALSEELVDLVAKTTPAIVALTGDGQDFTASGSGFFIDDDGHVVTNHHVVNGLAQPLSAGLHGGQRCNASVVGTDPLTDLALLKLDQSPPHHLVFREGPVRLGELCLALGSPFGMYPESVSLGVVSGLARSIPQDGRRPIDHAIQTDAAINPGNSGGPLIDVKGAVIGVNQSIDSRGTGIGFAVPADTVASIAKELKDYGSIDRASLGVSVVRATVNVDGTAMAGLQVARDGDPNDQGLQADDVLVKLDGQATDEVGDLYRILRRDLIGKAVNAQVVRGGKLTDLSITPTRLTT
jgi:S1-C subfamily serine protease